MADESDDATEGGFMKYNIKTVPCNDSGQKKRGGRGDALDRKKIMPCMNEWK